MIAVCLCMILRTFHVKTVCMYSLYDTQISMMAKGKSASYLLTQNDDDLKVF